MQKENNRRQKLRGEGGQGLISSSYKVGSQKTQSTATIAAAAAKSLQSRPTLWDPIGGSPLGSSVPGILQARTLEWVAISFSNAWKWNWKQSRSVVSDSSWPHGLQLTRLIHPWDFPGKSTGVGCHCLLWISSLAYFLLEFFLVLSPVSTPAEYFLGHFPNIYL